MKLPNTAPSPKASAHVALALAFVAGAVLALPAGAQTSSPGAAPPATAPAAQGTAGARAPAADAGGVAGRPAAALFSSTRVTQAAGVPPVVGSLPPGVAFPGGPGAPSLGQPGGVPQLPPSFAPPGVPDSGIPPGHAAAEFVGRFNGVNIFRSQGAYLFSTAPRVPMKPHDAGSIAATDRVEPVVTPPAAKK